MQQEILDEVSRFAPEMSSQGPAEILAHLQHYGFSTNFIDFTNDFLVALFFACDGTRDDTCENLKQKDGRLVLLSKNNVASFTASEWNEYWQNQKFVGGDFALMTQEVAARYRPVAVEVPETGRRIPIQKSVLVHARSGFVDPDCVIVIPSGIKDQMLEYLDKYHNINAATVYCDVHGYIQYYKTHRSPSASFYAGADAKNTGCYRSAIHHLTDALQLIAADAAHDDEWRQFKSCVILYERGVANRLVQEFEAALVDFNCVIEHLCHHAHWKQFVINARWQRAIIHMGLKNWNEAQLDLAQEGDAVGLLFEEEFQNVNSLESQLGVRLPGTIVRLLCKTEANDA